MLSIKRSLIVIGALVCAMALAPQRMLAQRSGVEVWAQTCGNCHTPQPAARYNAENWHRIVVHMMIQARLTDADADAVRQFLEGSARRIAANSTDRNQDQRIGEAVSNSEMAQVAATDSTAAQEPVLPHLTAELVESLRAYLRSFP